MANKRWRGDAAPVAQVTTVQVTAYDAATTYKLTVGNKVISVIAQGSVNLTASGLVTAWNASTLAEVAEVTASSNTDTVTLTADTSGKPFTVTSSVSGGTGTIGAASTTTDSAGPNHYDTAANWTPSGVPTGGDDVYFEGSDVPCLYGLDQSAVTLTSLSIGASYTGRIGLPDDAGDYYEYRQAYLKVGATTAYIGQGEGQGAGRIRLDLSSIQSTVFVHFTGASLDTGYASLQLKGTNAANVINVVRGEVDVAYFPGETTTFATVRLGYKDSRDADAVVRLSSGVSLTTIEKQGGQLEINSTFTTLTQYAGQTRLLAGTPGQLNIYGGDVVYNTAGTLGGNTILAGDGHLDFSQDPRGKAITNPINMYGRESRLTAPRNLFSGGVVVDLEYADDLSRLDFGQHVKLTVAAPT